MRGLKLAVVVGLAVSACIPPQPAASPESPQAESSVGNEPAALEANQGPESPAPAGPAAKPSGPAIVSLTLRNKCSKTVKLFYGKDPKFGSGRSSSIGGNSSQSEQFAEGDMLWITDDSGNGIANYSASAGVHEVEIASSCTSLMAH